MNSKALSASIHERAVITHSRSGGPGGQNVNKVNTKVSLRLRLDQVEGLSPAEMDRLREKLAPRLTGEGDLLITAGEERSQRINQERAFFRAEALIAAAARLPKHRRPTKPTRAAREERLKTKRLRGLTKTGRRFSPED